jgi:hypothetical protein
VSVARYPRARAYRGGALLDGGAFPGAAQIRQGGRLLDDAGGSEATLRRYNVTSAVTASDLAVFWKGIEHLALIGFDPLVVIRDLASQHGEGLGTGFPLVSSEGGCS